jgi:hypothetical protein
MPVSWTYSSINAGQESEVILILARTKSHIVGNRENNTSRRVSSMTTALAPCRLLTQIFGNKNWPKSKCVGCDR